MENISSDDRDNFNVQWQHMAKRLNQVNQQALDEKRIVGAVVMVAHQGNVVYQKAVGLADRENKRIMQADTIFLYSSLTKPIVSVAAMRLVEEGIMALDDPITKWLPAFKPQLGGQTPQITVHHLLTHTAGLSYGFWEPQGKGPYRNAGVSDGFDMIGVSLEENMRRLMSLPLQFSPGSAWLYSIGLDILGGAMIAATGLDLPDLVSKYVTAPLGMTDTGFSVTKKDKFFVPYRQGENEPVRMGDFASTPLPQEMGGGIVNFATQRIFDVASYPSGGAGMAGTAPDFMQFLLSFSKLLKPESVEKMMSLQVSAQAQTQGPGWGFGYGWAVLEDPKGTATPQSKGTLQWGGVYGHSWFVDPVKKLVVVALTNTSIEGMAGQYPGQIRDAVYDGFSHRNKAITAA